MSLRFLTRRYFTFGSVTIVIDDETNLVYTFFPSYPPIIASPEDTEEYKTCAKYLGYTSTEQLNREHDFLHSFLAAEMGLACSPTLQNVVLPGTIDADGRAREEGMVLAFQRYLNTGEFDGALWPLVIPYLEKLKKKVLEMLRE
jgi:hypothetical protein